MNFLKLTTVLLLIILSTGVVLSQDSVRVFVVGGGIKGEKFKYRYENKELLKFRVKGNFKYEFEVPIKKGMKYGSSIPIFIYRKGFFGLFYRRVGEGLYYDDNYKYLIIIRDERLKNRVPLEFKWSNEIPLMHH